MKTFFRLLAVSVAISFFIYSFFLFGDSINMLASHFQQLKKLPCEKGCYNIDFFFSVYYVVIPTIPLYELAIYPLARNWIPSTLKRAGIAAFGTSVALSVDMVGHAHTNATVECMFVENSASSSVLDINYFWIDIPLSIVLGIEAVSLHVALLEFLCAQAPYTMKGLIIGLSLASVLCLSPVLAGATLTTWAHAWSQPVTYPTCAFWFYLFIIVVTVVGLVMFGIVAKWYKKRERDELFEQQRFVEDYYNKYIH